MTSSAPTTTTTTTRTLSTCAFFQHDITLPDRGHSHGSAVAASPPSPSPSRETGVFTSRVFPAHTLQLSFQLVGLAPALSYPSASVTFTASVGGIVVHVRTVELGPTRAGTVLEKVMMKVSTAEVVLALAKTPVAAANGGGGASGAAKIVPGGGMRTFKLEAKLVVTTGSKRDSSPPKLSPSLESAGVRLEEAGARVVGGKGEPVEGKELKRQAGEDAAWLHRTLQVRLERIQELERQVEQLLAEPDVRQAEPPPAPDPPEAITFITFPTPEDAYEFLDLSPDTSDQDILAIYESLLQSDPPQPPETIRYLHGAIITLSLSRPSPSGLLAHQSSILSTELSAYCTSLSLPLLPPPPQLPAPPRSPSAESSAAFIQKGMQTAIAKLDAKLQQSRLQHEVATGEARTWRDLAEKLARELGAEKVKWKERERDGKKGKGKGAAVGVGKELEEERERRREVEREVEALRERLEERERDVGDREVPSSAAMSPGGQVDGSVGSQRANGGSSAEAVPPDAGGTAKSDRGRKFVGKDVFKVHVLADDPEPA